MPVSELKGSVLSRKKRWFIGVVLGVSAMAFGVWFLYDAYRTVTLGHDMAALYQINELIESKDYTQAKLFLGTAERELGKRYDFTGIRGDIAMYEGNYFKAVQYYSEAIATFDDSHSQRSLRVELVFLHRKLNAARDGRMWTDDELFSKDFTEEEMELLGK